MVEYSYVDDGGIVVRIDLMDKGLGPSLEYLHYSVDFDVYDPEPTYETLTFETPIDTRNNSIELRFPKSVLKQSTDKGYNTLAITNDMNNTIFICLVPYICDQSATPSTMPDILYDLRCGGWFYHNYNLHHPTITLRTDL